MKTTSVTVIKSGNSYALRVPKEYAVRNKLRPGAKVMLPDTQISGGTLEDLRSAIKISKQGKVVTAWDKVTNPSVWQRSTRSSWE